MVYTLDNPPKRFHPYGNILFCSNKLQNVRYILDVNGVVPVIIGRGDDDAPKIWIQTVKGKNPGEEGKIVMENSMPKHHAFTILEQDGALTVSAHNSKILEVKETASDSVEIPFIDLRPIGINLYGTKASLSAGGSVLANNTMTGAEAMIGFTS